MKLFILIALLLTILLHIYPIFRLLSWLDYLSKTTIIITIAYILFVISTAFLPFFGLKLPKIFMYDLGIIAFLVPLVILGDILWWGGIRFLIKGNILVIVILSINFILMFVSIYNFYKPISIKQFDLLSNKVSKDYSFLQITDIQFGTTNIKDLEKIVKNVENILEEKKIDAILFTGDAVDTYKFSLDDFKGFDFINYPNLKKYFVTGNHDTTPKSVEENISNIIKKLGYDILKRKKIDFSEDINIIGIDDNSKELEIFAKDLDYVKINKLKYNILMYHRPINVDEAERSGILISEDKKTKNNGSYQPLLKRPKQIDAHVIRFQNDYEKWIAVIGSIEGRPYEIFTGKMEEAFDLPSYVETGWVIKEKIGENENRYDFQYEDKQKYRVTIQGLSRSFNKEYWNYAKMISAFLRNGVPVLELIDIVQSLNLYEEHINTWKNGVVKSLKRFIPDGSKPRDKKCLSCGDPEGLVFEEGCLQCKSCGYSKCG